MSARILEIKTLSKSFPLPIRFREAFRFKTILPQTAALKNISFQLAPGKALGILGPNGAGKTTLLKIISTLILPDTGLAKIGNYIVGKDDEKIKFLIGFASSDERSFYWRLTGRQNLNFFASLYGFSAQEAKTRINELLKKFDIDYQDKRFDAYSAGMKRTFSLLRAMLHAPEILILDEPTKSLDFVTAAKLRSFISLLIKDGKTVILATHDFEEAEKLCDQFLILDKGQARAFGSRSEIKEQTQANTDKLSDIYLKATQND